MKRSWIIFLIIWIPRETQGQIPFEVLVGHQETQYFSYIQKDLDSLGRWNLFSQSVFAVNYRDSSLNRVSIDGQVTYMINSWLGIAAGGAFDGIQFNPTLGFSLTYVNPKQDFVITAFPTLQLANPRSLDGFALINYVPQFNKSWGLFTQAILGTNLSLQKGSPNQRRDILNFFTRHNGSALLLRVGFNYQQRFQCGVGVDLTYFGKELGNFMNAGFFIRYQLE